MGNVGRPIILIVRDGWGANPYPEWNHANAVHLAATPVDERLMADYPHTLIHTSGEHVGLPDGVTGTGAVTRYIAQPHLAKPILHGKSAFFQESILNVSG